MSKTDRIYSVPCIETVELEAEELVCGSVNGTLSYGSDNKAGSVDNDNYVDGGSF